MQTWPRWMSSTTAAWSMMACGPILRSWKMIAEDKISVSDYAQRAIKEEEQVTDAAKLLEKWAHQDAELKAALLEPLLKQACYQAVTRACRVYRRKVWTAPNYTKSGNGQRVVALANSLMDFPLPGGVRLRDATKKQIEEAAGFYGRQARQMAVITACCSAYAAGWITARRLLSS